MIKTILANYVWQMGLLSSRILSISTTAYLLPRVLSGKAISPNYDCEQSNKSWKGQLWKNLQWRVGYAWNPTLSTLLPFIQSLIFVAEHFLQFTIKLSGCTCQLLPVVTLFILTSSRAPTGRRPIHHQSRHEDLGNWDYSPRYED